MTKAPKIRFPGFTDDWEQRKLGDVSNVFEYGLNAAAIDFDGENQYIRITDIDDQTHLFNHNNITSPSGDISSYQNYRLNEGDILFARTGASVGKTYKYRLSDGLVYYAGFLIRAKINDKYDSEFVFQSTLTDKYKQFIRITSQRSGQPGVNAQEYSRYEFMAPEIEEQQQIGSFFKSLDDLITLHQRKLDNEKLLKQGLLQKMFPKDGETTPEVRFTGFTDAWEQRKVSELFNITRGYVLAAPKTSKTSSSENPYPVYSSQTKDNGLMGYYSEYLYENAITWTTDGANAGTVTYRHGKFYCTNVCGVLLSKDGYANQAVAEALNKVAWKWVSHVGNPKLMNNVMGEIPIMLPPSISEQMEMSNLFRSIDDLITLHQCKLDNLKQLKQALLQQMFI